MFTIFKVQNESQFFSFLSAIIFSFIFCCIVAIIIFAVKKQRQKYLQSKKDAIGIVSENFSDTELNLITSLKKELFSLTSNNSDLVVVKDISTIDKIYWHEFFMVDLSKFKKVAKENFEYICNNNNSCNIAMKNLAGHIASQHYENTTK